MKPENPLPEVVVSSSQFWRAMQLIMTTPDQQGRRFARIQE